MLRKTESDVFFLRTFKIKFAESHLFFNLTIDFKFVKSKKGKYLISYSLST